MAKDTPAKKEKVLTPIKRAKQNEKRRLINKSYRSKVRTAIRNFEELLSSGDVATIQTNLSQVYSLMDKGVKKGIYKLNNASRTKARMTAKVLAKAS